MISMVVVAFVTAAMVIVMSAFGGIEGLVQNLFANFDAPLTILPKEGKNFPDSLVTNEEMMSLPGIAAYSRIIEEEAWLNCVDHNTVATLKGVEENYTSLLPLDSMIYLGRFLLKQDSIPYAVVGLGVRGELMMPLSPNSPTVLNVNAPVRGRKLSRYRENAFNKKSIMVSGIFSASAELDRKYVFVPLDFARNIYEMENDISAVEIRTDPSIDPVSIKSELEKILPGSLKVQTRNEKNALVYKVNQSEKWFTFLILFFILIIACFNIVASLTIMIIEKKKDIYILGSMGAGKKMIERIFIYEGIFINAFGAIAGVTLGVLACWLQLKFGLVTMEGAIVDYYPVIINGLEVAGIFFTVIITGSVFCFSLVRILMKRFAWNAVFR